MAGTENSKEPIFKLKLLVDKKKNKVVLAEAGKDFVDVLFSFLTLPMGTIVRLLEKYKKNQMSQSASIGCLNNLYKSVGDLGTTSFLTEACKTMLLYPRNVVEKEKQRRRLKLNIDDTEVLKNFICASCPCPSRYSKFCSSRCTCGALMGKEYRSYQDVASEDIFISNKTLFTLTDNMLVEFTAMGLTLKMLKGFGYTDVDQIQEMFVDVNHEKVLALLECLFSSDTPLTDVFLMKRTSCAIKKVHNMPSLGVQEQALGNVITNKIMSVSLFTRKLDMKVLYVEGGKDFVDLLFTFLALPLKFAWELSGNNIVLGCIDNLYKSFKSLSSREGRNVLSEKCLLPWYYSCKHPLLDVDYAERDKDLLMSYSIYCSPIDPRYERTAEYPECSGFVKRGRMYMVSDDLTITPMDLSSHFYSLKKLNTDLDDIEEQVININKVEAIGLLRASLMTSTALTTVFKSLLPNKLKEEKL